MQEIKYFANGYQYKFIQEHDGWWSIYRWHEFNREFMPIIQSKDLEHCKKYCDFCEIPNVSLQKL